MTQPDLAGELAAVVRTLFGVPMAHQPVPLAPAVPASVPAAVPSAVPTSLPVPDLAPLHELDFLDE